MKKLIMACVAAVAAVVALGAEPEFPEGVTRLQYISASGSQYLDTGIKLKAPNDTVRMKFMCTQVGEKPKNGGVLFGNRKTAAEYCFIAHYNDMNEGAITVNNGPHFDQNRFLLDDNTRKLVLGQVFEIEASIAEIIVKTGADERTANPRYEYEFETLGTCTVLKGVAVTGGTLPNSNGCIGNLYAFSIERDGELIIDLYPAKQGDVVGMWDAVSSTMFKNQGTDAFVAGPEYVSKLTGHLRIVSASGVKMIDPAAADWSVRDGESVVCSAWSATNLMEMTRTRLIGYTLETLNADTGVYSRPVTNLSSVYEHVQQGDADTRLTWLWAEEEPLLRVWPVKDGKMKVNEELVPETVSHPVGVPAGYTALQYVMSTGGVNGCYVDTGLKLKAPEDCVYMKFRFREPITEGGVLFGSRESSTKHCFLSHFDALSGGGTNFAVTINNSNWEGNRWMRSLDGDGEANHLYEINASIRQISVWRDGQAIPDCGPVEPKSKDVFETPGNCWVLKGNPPESAPVQTSAAVDLYRFCIQRNGVRICDLLPVRNSDGVVGLYDVVRDTFLPSESSDPFLAGPTMADEGEWSELWLKKDADAKLEAVPARRFLTWVGAGLEDDEATANPLEKKMDRGYFLVPEFSQPLGLILIVQ